MLSSEVLRRVRFRWGWGGGKGHAQSHIKTSKYEGRGGKSKDVANNKKKTKMHF